jgi:hypothetical protein
MCSIKMNSLLLEVTLVEMFDSKNLNFELRVEIFQKRIFRSLTTSKQTSNKSTPRAIFEIQGQIDFCFSITKTDIISVYYSITNSSNSR